jgi:wyosine [tRNA(Phe)-imidazoG37] synthetase (radical SAM superfamily)
MLHQVLNAHSALISELGLDPGCKWRNFHYVYAGVSRRAGGVSIGINLSPDKICNFNCVYCEVDRHVAPRVREVRLDILEAELRAMMQVWLSGELFAHEAFAKTPPALRYLRQITFSGDGEPTASAVFELAVNIANSVRKALAPADCQLVLITDSACLERPGVRAGLQILRSAPHQIWAKLDAGTEAYYREVNRTQVPYNLILQNIASTAKEFPLFVQSLFLRIRGIGPSAEEIDAYCDRLEAIGRAGGRILGIQLNTIARRPPEDWAAALSAEELERVAAHIKRRNGLPQQIAYATTYQVSRQAVRLANLGKG